jgi:hypothetical protein
MPRFARSALVRGNAAHRVNNDRWQGIGQCHPDVIGWVGSSAIVSDCTRI